MSSNCYVLIGFINIPSIQNQSGSDTTVKLLLKKKKKKDFFNCFI